jgi:hypothetical protein
MMREKVSFSILESRKSKFFSLFDLLLTQGGWICRIKDRINLFKSSRLLQNIKIHTDLRES